MTRCSKLLTLLLLFCGLLAPGALAQDQTSQSGVDEQGSLPSLEEIDRTTIVWLREGVAQEAVREQFVRRKVEVTATFPELNGFAVRLSPSELQQLIAEAPEDFSGVESTEPDGLVTLFPSGCTPPTALPSPDSVPPGVTRLRGPIQLPQRFSRRVWIVDSGIALDYDPGQIDELNVDRQAAAQCGQLGCASGPAEDYLGHGTAIAGIIGAKDNDKGIIGVAPGARLVPIRAFIDKTVNWPVLYHAMAHVAEGAVAGDVVNLSWGADWNVDPTGEPRRIETILRQLADRGVRVAVAAGNADGLAGTAYVQTVTPARAGGYRGTTGEGAVMTVSAVDAADKFWPESGFGNGEPAPGGGHHLGPPDVAEPGVDIPVLALNGKARLCTGTSFAAAHLSGILLQGLPEHDGSALEDVDDKHPVTGVRDPVKDDPIGVCSQDDDQVCRAR